MRDWMRNKMRRRTKRGPNTSEATGKIGQEIPSDQPAALRPNYPDEMRQPVADEPGAMPELAAAAISAGEDRPSGGAEGGQSEPVSGAETPGKIVVETQPESLATPPAEAPSLASGGSGGDRSAPKGYVVLAIGLPGSGKTTWFKRRGVTPLSSDMLRSILFDDITDQRYSGLVFSTLRSLLRARLIAKMPWNYVDATNLSAHERRQWIKMARSFGFEAQAVFFDVPLTVCMERNSKRDRRVADEVMRTMAERLRPPSFKEGFAKITVVRVKGQPGNTNTSGTPPEAFNAPVPADEDELPGASAVHEISTEQGEERVPTLASENSDLEVAAHDTEPHGASSEAAEGRSATLADAHGTGGRAVTLRSGLTGVDQPDTSE